MAAINLPNNPTDGQTTIVNGVVYVYNSAKGYWRVTKSVNYETFSGDYNDLVNKPTIPTDINQLTDDDNLLP